MSKKKGTYSIILFLVLITNLLLLTILLKFKTDAMTNTFSEMDSTLSDHNKTVHPKYYDNSPEKLIAKLYKLKEKFQSMYYGKAECKKYDKARAFTIELNATLYEANQIQSRTGSYLKKRPLSNKSKAKIYLKGYAQISDTASKQIKVKIKELDKELNILIH